MQCGRSHPPNLASTRLAVVAVLAFVAVALARADDALEEGDWRIHVEFHAITLPEKKALALLPELRDETTIAAAWAKLEAMIAKDGSKVFGVLIGETTGGEKIEVRQGEEVRYATEFSPPSVIEPATAQPKGSAKVLLGFFKLEEPAGKVEVFILTTTIVKVGVREGAGARSGKDRKR